MKKGYVTFLKSVREYWGADRVVHIGDAVDHCALSFHKKKPHLKNARDEYEKARDQLWELWEVFPKLDWLIGNHDALPYRWCEEVGIDESMMKDPVDMFELKGWKYYPRYFQLEIEGVIYQHGDRGSQGQILSAVNNAKGEFVSVVQGHHHSQAGASFYANKRGRVFGLQVGCGIDATQAAMEYGIKYTQKPILGCGIVIDGTTPIFEPMPL